MFNKKRILELEGEVLDLRGKLATIYDRIAENEGLSNKLNKSCEREKYQIAKIEELRTLVRDQSKADTYLKSAMIMKKIEAGKEVKKECIVARDNSLQQMMAMSRMSGQRDISRLHGYRY